MSIHVSSSLDQDQRIYRPISFYGLVELITFGRLSFNQSSRIQLASLQPPIRNRKVMLEAPTRDMLDIQCGTLTQTSAASTTVAYQSWALLEHEYSIDWDCEDASAPSIYIVSSIHALAKSLFVKKDLEVFIDRTSRFAGAPTQRRPTRSISVPTIEDGTLTVTVWPSKGAVDASQNLELRLPVDLRTLLASVVLSPKAPTRFFELVSDLVQRISYANVSRASG